MKCPPQAHVLKAWSLSGGPILGDTGNLQRWDIPGGRKSLGGRSFVGILSPATSYLWLGFLSTMRWRTFFTTGCHCHGCWSLWGQLTMDWTLWNCEPSCFYKVYGHRCAKEWIKIMVNSCVDICDKYKFTLTGGYLTSWSFIIKQQRTIPCEKS